MTDPEIAYRRIVSGDAGAVRADAERLGSLRRDLNRAGDDVHHATGVPVWSGEDASDLQSRASAVLQGIRANHVVLARAQVALETAASAYDTAIGRADHHISFWRNRAPGPSSHVDEPLARTVNARLSEVSSSYAAQLSAAVAGLGGRQDVDLDRLDAKTRAWVRKGMDRSERWLDGNGSSRGPLIPFIAATGDGRGWIPQGLGYDPSSGTLLQSYYNHAGKPATMALIDERTGRPIGDVALGGYTENGRPTDCGAPGHAGGVAVDGDNVYVTSEAKVYTYSLNDLQNASPGQEVLQVQRPQHVAASSYGAVKDGQLFVGAFARDRMHVYDRAPSGAWVPATGSDGTPVVISTPGDVQGVLVRDGEFVYSTSSGRGNQGHLIVQDRATGECGADYPMPTMSEGLVEARGELITTFESGAEEYAHWTGRLGWLWGVKDADSLWANPHMTRTPLAELGLSGERAAEPAGLRTAAGHLGAPAAALRRAASTLTTVHVVAQTLRQVPGATSLADAVNALVEGAADSLRTGADAVDGLAEALVAAGHHDEGTGDAVSHPTNQLNPW